jgi:hypothetical protein
MEGVNELLTGNFKRNKTLDLEQDKSTNENCQNSGVSNYLNQFASIIPIIFMMVGYLLIYFLTQHYILCYFNNMMNYSEGEEYSQEEKLKNS